MHPGTYRYRVRAKTVYGYGDWTELSEDVEFVIEDPNSNFYLWLGILLSFVVILLLCSVGGVFYMRQQKHNKALWRTFGTWVEEEPEYLTLYKEDEWELKRDDVILSAQIGHGSFGTVFEVFID